MTNHGGYKLAPRTHCKKRGHPLTKGNLVPSKDGRRRCLICHRIRREEYEKERRPRTTNRVQEWSSKHSFTEPSSVRDMTEIELAWLAGWLEGEGSFILQHNHGMRYPRVSASSTDRDVLEYILAITGVGTLYDRPKRFEHYKDQWAWMVYRKNDAVDLMTRLAPYMFGRRWATINAILKEVESERV